VVDWDTESLWDNAAAAASLGSGLDLQEGSDQPSDPPAGGVSGPQQVTVSVDSLARAAVALDVASGEAFEVASAHTFLQRLLYKINRLNHFW